jgi:hypothetical protein
VAATSPIDTGPPYRFWPGRRIVGVQWGGEKCYVLLQFFSQEGDVQIEIPDQPPRFDDKGKLIQNVHKDAKVVYSRNVNMPGNEGYEGIFLIEVNKLPKPDPVTGKVPAVFTAKLKGADRDATAGHPFCAPHTLRVVTGPYTIGRAPYLDSGLTLGYNLFQHKLVTDEDPNGVLTDDTNYVYATGRTDGDPEDNTTPGGTRWRDLVHSTPVIDEGTAYEMWVLDPATGKFQNLHIPCHKDDVQKPGKTKFSFTGYLFTPKADFQLDLPTSDLDTVRRYYPIKQKTKTLKNGGTTGGANWEASFLVEIISGPAMGVQDIEDGDYDFFVQRRKFRKYDLSTDHDGDLPPLKPPYTPAQQAAWQAANDAVAAKRHEMLELWPSFPYRITRFRYPGIRPANAEPGTLTPINAVRSDPEWKPVTSGDASDRLNGAPPILQTEN